MKMENDPAKVEISVNELKLLTSTLSKSVAVSLKKRFAWLWLIAGLLTGVIITLLIVSLALKNTDTNATTSKALLKQADNISATSKSLLKQTDVVMSDLQKIHSDIHNLTVSVDALNQKTKAVPVPPQPSQIKMKESKIPQNNNHESKYRVYLHYSDLNHKQIMKNFSLFLKEKGFEVHDQDKNGAEMLKQFLTRFISSANNIKKEPIRVINLSRKYPKAQKGLLEVWVDF
jgi:uncharacterized protein YoxC